MLSVTDNLVNDKIVHPEKVVIGDGDDPYFVVAADKGTASFSDIANAIALERNFWLGDAFASGGSNGYDHKEMGITAKGAWISVQRHFLEMGVDVQSRRRSRWPAAATCRATCSATACCCRRRSSWSPHSTTATSSSTPTPIRRQAGTSATRMFELPRSSWDDYDRKLLSQGRRGLLALGQIDPA